MPVAARLGDPLQHSNEMWGLLTGLAVGLVIGAAIVATGGAAAVVLVATAAGAVATGAGVGEMLGSLQLAGGTITGKIATGSPDVAINGMLAARAFASAGDSVQCDGVPPLYLPPSHQGKRIAQGSASVAINGQPAARVADKIECGAQIQSGSTNVLIEGGQVTKLEIATEVPGWLNNGIMLLGLGSAVILVGPVLALAGLGGGLAGGFVASGIGGSIFGEGSDGQKIMGFIGGFIGGALAVHGAGGVAKSLGDRVGGDWGKFIEGGFKKVYAPEPPAAPTGPPTPTEQITDFVDNKSKGLDFTPPERAATADLPAAKEPAFFSGKSEDGTGMGTVAQKSGYLTVNESEGGIAAGALDDATAAKGVVWDARRGIWVAASEQYAEGVGQQYGTIDPATQDPLSGPKAGQPIKVFVSQEYMDDPARFKNTIFWQTERPILESYGVTIEYVVVK